jgi:uncharacterized membrane protein
MSKSHALVFVVLCFFSSVLSQAVSQNFPRSAFTSGSSIGNSYNRLRLAEDNYTISITTASVLYFKSDNSTIGIDLFPTKAVENAINASSPATLHPANITIALANATRFNVTDGNYTAVIVTTYQNTPNDTIRNITNSSNPAVQVAYFVNLAKNVIALDITGLLKTAGFNLTNSTVAGTADANIPTPTPTPHPHNTTSSLGTPHPLPSSALALVSVICLALSFVF